MLWVKIDGTRIRIGAGLHVGRVALDEYHSLLSQGRIERSGKLDPRALLKAAREHIWRFPWPDEQGQNGAAIARRELLRTEYITMRDVLIAHRSAQGMAFGSARPGEMFVPCPYSERGQELALDGTPPIQRAQIVGESFTGSARATLFACEYCRVRFQLTGADLVQVKRQNPAHRAVLAMLRALPRDRRAKR